MMDRRVSSDSVAPLVIGAVTALEGAREAVRKLSRRHLPDDPEIRSMLRESLAHGAASLRALEHALQVLRDRLG